MPASDLIEERHLISLSIRNETECHVDERKESQLER